MNIKFLAIILPTKNISLFKQWLTFQSPRKPFLRANKRTTYKRNGTRGNSRSHTKDSRVEGRHLGPFVDAGRPQECESQTNRYQSRQCNENNDYNPRVDFSSLSTGTLHNVNALGNGSRKIRRASASITTLQKAMYTVFQKLT